MIAISRYWHTLRYLRPVQIYGRLWFRLYQPRPVIAATPPWRTKIANWVTPAGHRSRMLGANRFCFLNEEGVLAKARDWNVADKSRLWLYNLHYFEDLVAHDAADREHWHRALLTRWVEENPPGQGVGWEPYPVAMRMVNWAKWHLAGNPLEPSWCESLANQARWLRKRLEWHLLGNHLFLDAKALIFAGLLFRGSEAEEWLRKGLDILREQIPEQILADGGQFERSPMYHALALEDMLDLINLVRTYETALPESAQSWISIWPEVCERMLYWLGVLCHPDGNIALFNDAAFGIAPTLDELKAYAGRLGIGAQSPQVGVVSLPDSGYLRIEKGLVVALLDVGPIGPDYLPGHAHADTLSFELSFGGKRWIVDSGTSLYGNGPERLRQRSSAAHNTVEVDGQDSSEVWGGFRVARRARPFDFQLEEKGGEIRVVCAHDGYHRLPSKVTHRREWMFSNRECRVRDSLEGKYQQAIGRFHFHPDVEVRQEGMNDVVLIGRGGDVMRCVIQGGSCQVMDTTWHPEFGISEGNHCIEVTFLTPECEVIFSWT